MRTKICQLRERAGQMPGERLSERVPAQIGIHLQDPREHLLERRSRWHRHAHCHQFEFLAPVVPGQRTITGDDIAGIYARAFKIGQIGYRSGRLASLVIDLAVAFYATQGRKIMLVQAEPLPFLTKALTYVDKIAHFTGHHCLTGG